VRDLRGGAPRTLRATPGGLNITPDFAGDGTIVYAHGEENGTDLVATSIDGGPTRRVTVGRGTDNVSPSFSPDGRRVAFTSGRPGHPEVYITDADGTNAELLTPYSFGDQSYRSNPDWSPDGRVIAFQSQLAGRFHVMTISLRDRSVKQLTTDGSNEDPSWAPDSRHLVLSSTRGGTRQLWVLDAESGRMRQLTRGAASRLPAWSPALQRAP
jgi:TolB protein